jgi:hypothetical protein
MVNCFYDLHIHTALSPCSSDDMTPNNIVNMSLLKGLDIIGITDHNSAKNVASVMKCAEKTTLIVIPGIEVETFEGIHLLCYFKTIKNVYAFDKIIYDNLPEINNNEDFYGRQLIIAEDDRIIAKEKKALLNSTSLKIDKVIQLAHKYQGIVIPAHIDRRANGIISILGFIPPNLAIEGIEIQATNSQNNYRQYRVFQNSDAHYLGDICEKVNKICLSAKNCTAFFKYFGGEI